MTTATKAPRTRSVKVAEIDGDVIYATATGVKAGARGRVVEPTLMYRLASKGQARKLRKALRATGFKAHAAAPRG